MGKKSQSAPTISPSQASAYLKANPDVAADPYYSKHPYEHYQKHGQAEGRSLTPGGSSGTEIVKSMPINYRNQSTQQTVSTVDYAAENERRRRANLQSQATDIINDRLKYSQTQSNLYGTRYRSPSNNEFNNLVSTEFQRLLKMDSGESVDDLGAPLKKRKYEGFKRGRGMASEQLGEGDLLG